MSTLNHIVAQRLKSLESQKELYPEQEIMDAARQSSRPTRSLYDALQQPQTGFILECKKASPSKGLIRSDFDPVAIASVYQRYAAALSVLTEPEFFQGSFAYIQAVSQRALVPVINKDFIVTPYQVALARYFGADAILLMLSILDDATYTELAALAKEMNLEVLTEVSTEQEMRRAANAGAQVIGINHRNLHDLTIDMNRSKDLAKLAPEHAVLVGESGITEHLQMRDIAQHVDAFLVGSHLTAQDDIDLACRELIYGHNKVCGLTDATHAFSARDNGAVYGGFIFSSRSPRKVSKGTAQAIIRQCKGLNYVGVFTPEHDQLSAKAIAGTAIQCGLTAVQIHDTVDQAFISALRSQLPESIAIWYATHADKLTNAPAQGITRFLADNGKGGTGATFDWSQLPESTKERSQLLLAGGLTPDNIKPALALGCYGLDINSGAEVAPGVKDPARIQRIFEQIRDY